jgi:hypothetical protein
VGLSGGWWDQGGLQFTKIALLLLMARSTTTTTTTTTTTKTKTTKQNVDPARLFELTGKNCS